MRDSFKVEHESALDLARRGNERDIDAMEENGWDPYEYHRVPREEQEVVDKIFSREKTGLHYVIVGPKARCTTLHS